MGVLPSRFNRTASNNSRRLANRQPARTFPANPVAGDIWYETDAKILWLWNGSGWVVIMAQGYVAGTTNFLDGLELYHPSSTPYIDFHRAANPAGDSNADYNVRLINDSSTTLQMPTSAGGRWGMFSTGSTKNATMGAYGWDQNWAHFGAREAFDAADGYAFMSHSGGDTIVSGRGTTYIRAQSAQNRMRFDGECHTYVRLNVSGGVLVHSDWYRIKGSNGFHWDDRGGGFQMPTNDWVETYPNGKNFYSGGVIKAGDSYHQTWGGGGGHSICSCWGASNTKGFLCRSDGNQWVMMETQFFIRGNDGGDYFNFYRFGDVRMNVPTVAPGDPDLRIAGSHQLLRNASNRHLKKNITPLQAVDNPVWNIPVVRYHWKDDQREHGARFNARNPKGRPGFIAEDLFEAAPDATTVNDDGTPNGPDTWSLLAYIIAGMQELKKQVDKLEGKK